MNLIALDTYPERLSGYYMRVKQIILSILSSSIKYTDEGLK